jgi:ankyrin repeat protein
MGEEFHLFNFPRELLDEISSHLSVPQLGLFMRANKQLHKALYPQIIKQAIREDDKYKSPFNLAYAAVKDNMRVFEAILEKTKVELLAETSLLGNILSNLPHDEVIGTTILHVATVHCKPIYLRRLLEKGSPISALDRRLREGRTPIQVAAKFGCLDNMKVLVAFGADVNDQVAGNGNFAWTPLHRAVASHDLEMVRFLLSAGADPRVRMGPLLATTVLIRAICWVEGLELLLEMHRFEEPMLTHALAHAVYNLVDFYHVAALLIKAGAPPNYQLLCVACRNESKPSLRSIELMAKFATAHDRDVDNLTALHQVAYADVAEVVIKTIPGIVNAKAAQYEWTPLQYLYGIFWPSQLREVVAEPILR